jgi:uncharacterized protein YndB with AHSA1/START domain
MAQLAVSPLLPLPEDSSDTGHALHTHTQRERDSNCMRDDAARGRALKQGWRQCAGSYEQPFDYLP